MSLESIRLTIGRCLCPFVNLRQMRIVSHGSQLFLGCLIEMNMLITKRSNILRIPGDFVMQYSFWRSPNALKQPRLRKLGWALFFLLLLSISCTQGPSNSPSAPSPVVKKDN